VPYLVARGKIRKYRVIKEAMRVREQSNAHVPW
jgi:hypothetical protein